MLALSQIRFPSRDRVPAPATGASSARRAIKEANESLTSDPSALASSLKKTLANSARVGIAMEKNELVSYGAFDRQFVAASSICLPPQLAHR